MLRANKQNEPAFYRPTPYCKPINYTINKLLIHLINYPINCDHIQCITRWLRSYFCVGFSYNLWPLINFVLMLTFPLILCFIMINYRCKLWFDHLSPGTLTGQHHCWQQCDSGSDHQWCTWPCGHMEDGEFTCGYLDPWLQCCTRHSHHSPWCAEDWDRWVPHLPKCVICLQ